MTNDYLVRADNDALVFRRPWNIRLPGIFGATFFGVLLLAVLFKLCSDTPQGQWLGFVLFLTMILLTLGPCLWMGLYLASPLYLRFDLGRSMYELRDGCFPWRRTEHGTVEAIESVYVFGSYAGSRRSVMYKVLLRWKKQSSRRRRSIILDWTPDCGQAEKEASEYARKIGVSRGDTVIQGRVST